MVVAMNEDNHFHLQDLSYGGKRLYPDQLPSTYEWPYDSPRRIDSRSGAPDWHPELGSFPPDPRYVVEVLDPKVLAARMKLFEVEHEKVFDVALKEVQDGYKNRDWIWSVFPQAAGLPEHFRKDSSETSRKFSILCLDEAFAFLEHPILGPNYLAIVEAVRNQLGHRGLEEIFGRDYKKVISSVTLFRRAARVCGIGSAPDDEEPWPQQRPLTEAERRSFGGWVATETRKEKERQKNREPWWVRPSRRVYDPEPKPEVLLPMGPLFAPMNSMEFGSPLGRVLIDHCDAILAQADDESLQSCSYSHEFDGLRDSWEWRGSGGKNPLSPHIPEDEEGGFGYPRIQVQCLGEEEVVYPFDHRPWRGDAWLSPPGNHSMWSTLWLLGPEGTTA